MSAESRVEALFNRIIADNSGAMLDPFNLVYNNIYVGGAPNDDGTFPHVDAVLNLRAESQITLNCKATLWMPIWDRPPFPGLDYLDTAVHFLESCNDRGWEVYVHCNAGLSRSGMVMCAFVMKHENVKLEKAWATLNAKRPCAPNPSFLMGLVEYEQYLKENN